MFWLWVILAIFIAGAAGYVSYRADIKRAISYPVIPALLRGLVILLTILLIISPTFTISKNETRKPIVLFLQDNSLSIEQALGEDSSDYKNNVDKLLSDLSEGHQVITWDLDGNKAQDSIFSYEGQTTDINKALQSIQEFYGTQNLGAVILATDGKYNQGVNPLYSNTNLNGALYTIGIGDTTTKKDISITKTYANRTVSKNNSFEVRADILASKSKGYNNSVRIMENNRVVSTAPLSIGSDKYDGSISFTIRPDRSGLHHYTIVAPENDGEINTANNRKDFFVEVVDEQKQILIAGLAPHPDIKAIKQALEGLENYKIVTRVNNDLPSLLDEYDVMILHELPALSYSDNQTISRANLPKWYIVGSNTNNQLLTNTAVDFKANTRSTKNVFPVYNAAFSTFTTPKNIRAVLEKLPPLTSPDSDPQLRPEAQSLFTSKTDKTAPLWTFLSGKTPTVVTTGVGLWRWRMYEYKNFSSTDVIDDCIRQTVAFLLSGNNKDPFRVTLPKYIWSDQESVNFNAYLQNDNSELINQSDIKLELTDSAGNKKDYTFDRSGNSYKLNTGIHTGGTYSYTATTTVNGKTLVKKGSFVIDNIPLELMQEGADYNMLYSLSEKYNGSFFTLSNLNAIKDSIVNNQQITPVIETNIEIVPLIDRRWLFFIILLVAVAEWLLRKYWLAQ